MKKTMKKLIALAVVFVMLLTAVPAFASGQSCSTLSKSEDAQPVLWKCRKHKENTGKIQQLQSWSVRYRKV